MVLPAAAANSIVQLLTGQSLDLGSSDGVLLLDAPSFTPRRILDPLPVWQDPSTAASTAPAQLRRSFNNSGASLDQKTSTVASSLTSLPRRMTKRVSRRSRTSRGTGDPALKDLEGASSLDVMLPFPGSPPQDQAEAQPSFQLAAFAGRESDGEPD